jgi:hypothetical protein
MFITARDMGLSLASDADGFYFTRSPLRDGNARWRLVNRGGSTYIGQSSSNRVIHVNRTNVGQFVDLVPIDDAQSYTERNGNGPVHWTVDPVTASLTVRWSDSITVMRLGARMPPQPAHSHGHAQCTRVMCYLVGMKVCMVPHETSKVSGNMVCSFVIGAVPQTHRNRCIGGDDAKVVVVVARRPVVTGCKPMVCVKQGYCFASTYWWSIAILSMVLVTISVAILNRSTWHRRHGTHPSRSV